jgi:hypothetical protein
VDLTDEYRKHGGERREQQQGDRGSSRVADISEGEDKEIVRKGKMKMYFSTTKISPNVQL